MKIKSLILFFLIGMTAVVPVLSQDNRSDQRGNLDFPVVRNFSIKDLYGTENIDSVFLTGKSMIGRPVVDPDGKTVGETKNFAVDVHAGYIPVLTFSFNDSQRDIPLPLEYFIYNINERTFMLNLASYDLFKQLPENPGLSMFNSPVGTDNIWSVGYYSYWGNRAVLTKVYDTGPYLYGENGRSFNFFTGYMYNVYASGTNLFPRSAAVYDQVLKYPVGTKSGEQLGSISDFIVDPITGRIRYVIVSPSEGAKIGAGPFVIPTPAFTLDPRSCELRYDLQVSALESAPEVNLSNLQSAQTGKWDSDLLSYWSSQSVTLDLRGGMRIVPNFYMRAGTVMGYDVLNFNRQGIGEIKDVLVEKDGTVRYALVELQDFLDLGGRVTFIPLRAISLDIFNTVAMVDIPEADQADLPTYDVNSMPDFSSEGWDSEVHDFWTSYASKAASADTSSGSAAGSLPLGNAASSYRASAIIDSDVQNPEGNDLGDIEDIMLDLENGKVSYLALQFGGFLGVGDSLFAIPLSAVQIDTPDGLVIFNVTQDRLDRMQGFNQDLWPAQPPKENWPTTDNSSGQ